MARNGADPDVLAPQISPFIECRLVTPQKPLIQWAHRPLRRAQELLPGIALPRSHAGISMAAQAAADLAPPARSYTTRNQALRWRSAAATPAPEVAAERGLPMRALATGLRCSEISKLATSQPPCPSSACSLAGHGLCWKSCRQDHGCAHMWPPRDLSHLFLSPSFPPPFIIIPFIPILLPIIPFPPSSLTLPRSHLPHSQAPPSHPLPLILSSLSLSPPLAPSMLQAMLQAAISCLDQGQVGKQDVATAALRLLSGEELHLMVGGGAAAAAAGGPTAASHAPSHLRLILKNFKACPDASRETQAFNSLVLPLLRLLSHEGMMDAVHGRLANAIVAAAASEMSLDKLAAVYGRLAQGSDAVQVCEASYSD
jgi:hypothetical protein